MSDNDSKVRFTQSNSFFRNQPAKRRASSIRSKARVNGWAVADVTRSLPAHSVGKLNDYIRHLTETESVPELTSVEDLRNWANTRNGCRLGDLVAMNVPVVCTGCLVNSQEMKEVASTREGFAQPPEHMRWGAHGITFGSLFVKTFSGTGSDGQRFTKEIKTFIACNNCLDTWVGKLSKDGNRSTGLWPFKPHVPQKQGQRKPDARKPRPKTPSTVQNKALEYILKNIQHRYTPSGNEVDMWKKVTITMLQSYFNSEGLTVSGRKAEQVQAFLLHIQEKEPAALDAVNSKLNARAN